MKGYRYHHIGIPTSEVRPGECYLEQYKMFVVGFEDSRFGVEWLRFDDDCPLPDLVKQVAHVAFVVDHLEAALAGQIVLIQPNSPSPGVTVAFIEHNGAPVEFLQFDGPQFEVWPGTNAPD